MDLGAARALALAINFDVYGVPATVTRPAPDDLPIVTTGVWLTPLAEELPVGVDFGRRESRKVLAFKRPAVPHAPRGTLIAAPELGGDGTVKNWRVDGIERTDPDHLRLIVVLVA